MTEIKRYPKQAGANQPSTTEDPCQNTKFHYDYNPYGSYGSVVEYKICGQNKNGVATERTVREMYSYSQRGQVVGRRFRLIRPFEGNANWAPAADADVTMAWNGLGQLTQLVQPEFKTWDSDNHNIYTSPGYTLDYTFNLMNQMTGLTRKQGTNPAANIVTGMTYGPGGEMLTMQHWQLNGNAGQYETRQYNVLGQLTRIQATATGGTPVDLEYIYAAGQNNGRITQRKNWLSGETVTYTYDSLQRLTQATAAGPSPWSESYSFDGFGNLTGKAGSNWAVNGLTNQIQPPPNIPLWYDANGNQQNSTTSAYDIENRLLTWDGAEQYRYGADNKRVFLRYTDNQNVVQERYHLYGPNGKLSVELAAVYDPALSALPTPGMILSVVRTHQYVGLRRVGWGEPMEDRLGTSPAGSGKPYGEGAGRYATHDVDTATGLHYADQRYYSSSWGRFLTADPYMHNPQLGSPQSWNLYSYGSADPITHADPTGLFSDPCANTGCLMAPPELDNASPPGGWITWTGGPLCMYNSWLPVPACYVPLVPAPEPPQEKQKSLNCGEANPWIPAMGATNISLTSMLLGENSWPYIGRQQYRIGDAAGRPTGPMITRAIVEAESMAMLNVVSAMAGNRQIETVLPWGT